MSVYGHVTLSDFFLLTVRLLKEAFSDIFLMYTFDVKYYINNGFVLSLSSLIGHKVEQNCDSFFDKTVPRIHVNLKKI